MATNKESLTVEATAPDLDELARLLEEEKRLALAFSGRERGDDVHPTEYQAWLDALNRAKLAAFHALPRFIARERERAALTAHWCKDGETLAERLQRERDDSLALMELLAREKQAHEATARRERRMREALEDVSKRWKDQAQSFDNRAHFSETPYGDSEHEWRGKAKALRARAADLDAALAEEGQDG